MIPSAAAAETADRALQTLSAADRARADVAAIVAAGRPLTVEQVNQVRVVLDQADQHPNDSVWRLAGNLVGGDAMRRQLSMVAAPTIEQANGQPDPGPHTGAMIAVVPDHVALQRFAVPDGLPPTDLHVTLAFLGPADDVPDIARVEIRAAMAELAGAWGPVTATAGHIAHISNPDDGAVAVAYDLTAPGLHDLRAELVGVLSDLGVDWSNRYAFRPHLTITYLATSDPALADWPEGPVDQPIVITLDHLQVRFGSDVDDRIRMATSTMHALRLARADESPVAAAAAAPGYPQLARQLDVLTAELGDVDVQVATEVRTAVALGWRSALDRVGRMATRQADAGTRRRCMGIDPALVAATAAADLSGLNLPNLIEPAVTDVANHVARIIGRAQAVTVASVADALGVDITPADYFPDVDAVHRRLEGDMTDWLLAVLQAGVRAERLDPSDGDAQPLLAPYQITRDVLAFAGGADLDDSDPDRDLIVRDLAGRPTRASTPGGDSVPLGPGVVVMVGDSIEAWADADVTSDDVPFGVSAAARRRPGIRIGDSLRAELADAGARLRSDPATDPTRMGVEQVWRLNWNGQAIENLPRHRKLAGTVIVDESELANIADAQADPNDWPGVAISRPGDHARCHCGWETRLRLIA